MPYGSPQGPTEPQYTLTFRSTTLIDGAPVTFQVTASTEAMGDPLLADVVQEFADTVHASAAFNLSSGARKSSYTETLTPSAVQ